MAKIVYTDLKPARSAGKTAASRAKPATVTTKRVRTQSGGAITIYKVDANSPTLGEDLGYAFTQNVKRVKREHNRLARSAARGGAKG